MSLANPQTVSFTSGAYFNTAFNQHKLIEIAETQILGSGVKFDSFVALGLSGLVAAPILAYHFKVPFLALRKPDVECHDGGLGLFGRGTIGKRWIFIDDLISSGKTVNNAREYVTAGLTYQGYTNFSEYVGTFLYERDGYFVTPDDRRKQFAKIEVDGKPVYVHNRAYNDILYWVNHFTLRNVPDPKGAAIEYCNKHYSYEYGDITINDLATMAVYVAKNLDRLKTRC